MTDDQTQLPFYFERDQPRVRANVLNLFTCNSINNEG